MSQVIRKTVEIGGNEITIETGRLAKQAHGSTLVSCGGTVVLVTACYSSPREGIDFFPLTVDYIEKTYAAGKYPGGFYKREARPRDHEILTSRLIDRSVRPLFPEGFRSETQIIATVMSHDGEVDSRVLAMTGASTSLHTSEMPWGGPLAAVRVGRINGDYIANPTKSQLEDSDLDLLVTASTEAIVMVECEANELPEAAMIDALMFAFEQAQPLLKAQQEIRDEVGKAKIEAPAPELPAEIVSAVNDAASEKLLAALNTPVKHERYGAIDALKDEVKTALLEKFDGDDVDTKALGKNISKAFGDLKSTLMRTQVAKEGKRVDGRNPTEIRPIDCDTQLLPRVHGSALFTRGETQALATVTLGTRADEQKVEDLTGEGYKKFMLHYNFAPFSVGEARMLRSVSRREIGHGNLAEKALRPIVPSDEDFPYTIRIVSETLESNGSSSMAATCGGCLALMDAGVPVKKPVAGIAMGLIAEAGEMVVLSDILGDEDHLGDMDFKVTGTADGITALQMDIKIAGVDRDVLTRALEQAREGRVHILGKMAEALDAPREDMSPYAPRITTLKIKPERIKDVIGPGGKVIKDIIARTGVTIDVEDDGTVHIASNDGEAAERAIKIVKDLTMEAEVGRIYLGKVVSIKDFGAFVEIFPGTDGLVHISELSDKRVATVRDVLKEGDEIMVKCLEVDRNGRIRLSRKQAMGATEADAG